MLVQINKTFFCLLLFFVTCFLHAQPKLDLSPQKQFPIKLISYCTVFKTADSLTILEVAQGSERLTQVSTKSSQGFSEDFFWIYFHLDAARSNQEWLLEVDNPHIDHIELYEGNDTFQKIGYGGDRGRKFSDRSYNNRRYIFPLQPSDSTAYWLMVDKRNASVSFPLKLWEKETFQQFEAQQNILYGIYFGMLFFVGFVALIYGLLIRQRLMILYGAYAVLMIFYLFTALGFSFQYLYPDSVVINNYVRLLLTVFIACLSTIFSRDFLNLDEQNPLVSRIFKFINYVFLGLIITWVGFTGLFRVYTIWILNIIYVLMLAIFVLSFVAGFQAMKYDRKYAITYLSAFSSLIIGCCLYMGIEYGLIQENIFPMNPVLLGSGLEIIILSFSMLGWSRDIYVDQNRLKSINKMLEKKNTALIHDRSELEAQIKKQEDKATQMNAFYVLKDKTKVALKDIAYINADGHYLEFHPINYNKVFIERTTIKEAIPQLPDHYVRVHRSYIVNIEHILKFNSSSILLNDNKELPVSRSYKQALFNKMEDR